MSKVDIMHLSFIWIGFDKKYDQEALHSEIAELQDMNGLIERDISDLEKSYANCPGKTGVIFFGLQRNNKIKALMHWVQYFIRVDEVPTFNTLENESFMRDITVASQRALIREKESKNVSQKAQG